MADRDAYRATADAEIARWERQLADELLRMWDRQEAVVLARLGGTKARKGTRHWDPPGETKINPLYVVDASRWLLEAAGAVRPILTRLFTETYGRMLARLQPDVDAPELPDDDLDGALARQVARIGLGVQHAIDEVQALIAAGEDAGAPMEQLAADVSKFYADRKTVWSGRVVSTSVVGSLNQASLLGAADAGCELKQWLSAHDNDVRPTHRAADAQVVPMTEPFSLGGFGAHPHAELLFPGDPDGPLAEVIHCRCTMLFPEPADVDALYSGGAAARGVIRARSALARGLDPRGPDAKAYADDDLEAKRQYVRDRDGQFARVAAGADDLELPFGGAPEPAAPAQPIPLNEASARAVWDGMQLPGGATAHVTWAGAGADGIDWTVRGNITAPDGAEIGTFFRVLHGYTDEVDHTFLKIEPEWSGKGLATALNAQAEVKYRQLGIQKINVSAASKPSSGFIGGYVWARRGFTWKDPESAAGIADHLLSSSLDRDDPGPAVLDAVQRLRSGDLEQMPSPFEISELRGGGFSPKMTARLGPPPPGYGADRPLGRDVLLNSTWKGVRWL